MFAYCQEKTDAFLNTRIRSYLTLHLFLLLLVFETDFGRVFPNSPSFGNVLIPMLLSAYQQIT